MKLLDYMKANNISDEEFAVRMGGSLSPSAIRKWKYDERMPRLPEVVRIEELTDGAVTARDFLPDQQAPSPPALPSPFPQPSDA